MLLQLIRSLFSVLALLAASLVSPQAQETVPHETRAPETHAPVTHDIAAPAPISHGIAMHGTPALPPDFDHLPYADPAARHGGKLAIGFQGTFDSLNPFNILAGSTAQGLNGNVFQTLMMRSLDEPFTLYGLIAQSIETNADRSFVTFRLDPRARFSDGSPVTSADVAFTFNLLKTKGRPQQRAPYGRVKSIATPDPFTVQYDLSGIDDREMPLTLALMPVLSQAHTDVALFDQTSLVPPVASGPYRVSKVRIGEKLVLAKNPDYWARDLPVHRGLYNFDTIEINYFRDATSLFEAFQAGLLDYREETTPTRWLTGYDFPAIRDGRIIRQSLPVGGPKGMEGMAFNTRHALFADVRVREALTLMFDFEWINIHVFGGLYTRTNSFFANSDLASTGRPASPKEKILLAPWPDAVRDDILRGEWSLPRSDGSGRDRDMPRRALALLAAAGYGLADGKLVKDSVPLAFEIMVQDTNQERLALNFAGSLKRIGVTADVRRVDEVQYQRRRQKFDFDMMFGTWAASASPGNEQRSRWGSASAAQEASFNLAGVQSPAIDAMIDSIVAAKTRNDFVTAVRAFDRLLLSGFYIVPLFHRGDQWFAASSQLARPARLPGYGAPLFGATLDQWWRKTP